MWNESVARNAPSIPDRLFPQREHKATPNPIRISKTTQDFMDLSSISGPTLTLINENWIQIY